VARERRIPYLGICLGMHVAVSEFARHVVGLDGANSTEMDPETPYPVIDLLPEQKGIEDLGGTMRLGAQAVEVADGTRTRDLYGETTIHERHRHRYEVNNAYRERLVEAGLPTPAGEEQAAADVVLRYLGGLGLEADEDAFGNVYARVEPTAEGTPLFFCAHLDTVPPSGELRPVVEDSLIRNAGGTILGGDNKAAVAQMLEGVRRVLAENIPHAGIELVLTRQEEVGLIGAAAFDHTRLRAPLGFAY